ncbi:hypothetical protein ACQX0N_11120 [Clostridium tepidum]|jgi:hypothetical protein|uniref:Uncharacterized protein n=1 Tax=Clostridium tepidum TaxID=1962263 RepID=A0A1S9HYK0_9CLOT|nr:hypothetical protein [Clostridium tepidum]MCR1934614.1 hypothetical protein [Clostridium tepidum]MDU6877647.1 hypothetical protein [Clostridium botulinum]OOO62510.1 hypothetical protein BS637_06635 [Clostridium tepidum]OOO63136.1 hypothetical protein BS638_13730 [Clostridium tepidum]
MNVFYLSPINTSYFEISNIEENQINKEYDKFINNIKSMDYINLDDKNVRAKIILDLFSVSFKINEKISIFLKYEEYMLEKKEIDPYEPLKKIFINTGNEKIDLTLELINLKPYKIKIRGDLYKRYNKKWEVKKFNQIIVL